MIPSITDMALSHARPTISSEAREALDKGDVSALMEVQRSRFAGWTMMADNSEDDDSDDDSDDGDDEEDEDDDDDEDDEDDESKASKKRIEELNAENKRRRKKAADQARRIKELEAEVAKKASAKKTPKKDGDESEDDDQVVELTDKVTTLQRTNEDLLIRLEFTNLVTGENAKHQFKNPAKALRLLDLDEVEITDKGDIEGLEDAIEDLAKSDPYLLVDSKDDDDEEEKPKRKTGQQTGSRRRGTPNRDKLVAKYPALRR